MLSEAINRIIKHHHKSLKERVSWAQLMCGELGLVHSLIQVQQPVFKELVHWYTKSLSAFPLNKLDCQVFSFGFKSARLFGKNLSVWDFFLKVPICPVYWSHYFLRLCTTSISQ